MLQLYPHQELAIQRIMENPYHYLAFDMGLGKTLTVLEYLRRAGKKAFIIAPLLVAHNVWPAEIKKWGFNFTWSIIHGKYKTQLLERSAQADILITNYASTKFIYEYGLKHGGSFFRDRVLVFDESTAFKRPTSKRFKMLQAMQHLFKQGVLNLSGEPMPEGYQGLWSQYWMLDRGAALGTHYSHYIRKYFYESGPPRWISRLQHPLMANEIKQAVAHETSVLRAEDYLSLPEAVYSDVSIHLDTPTMAVYKKLLNEYVFEADGREPLIADNAGVLTNKLRQVVSGAIYVDDQGSTVTLHTHKAQALAELMDEAQGSPILCPINFLFEIDMIRKELDNERIPCIHGKISAEEKSKILSVWNAGKLPLLLCHPASLSHGLNMQTGGSTIVWYSLPWSLEQYKQLNGRLIRPGQTKPVRIYHLVAKGTVDEKVASILAKKDATQEDFKFDLRLTIG